MYFVQLSHGELTFLSRDLRPASTSELLTSKVWTSVLCKMNNTLLITSQQYYFFNLKWYDLNKIFAWECSSRRRSRAWHVLSSKKIFQDLYRNGNVSSSMICTRGFIFSSLSISQTSPRIYCSVTFYDDDKSPFLLHYLNSLCTYWHSWTIEDFNVRFTV